MKIFFIFEIKNLKKNSYAFVIVICKLLYVFIVKIIKNKTSYNLEKYPKFHDLLHLIITRWMLSKIYLRVLHFQLLHLHKDAYEAGSVFPDSFYDKTCKQGKCFCKY